MIVNGIAYVAEDAEFFADGSVCDATLLRDAVIQGLPCTGGRSVAFYDEGALRLARRSREADVGRIACAPGIVYLHPNGNLLNGCLATRCQFGAIEVDHGERVTLDETGRLLEYSRRLERTETIGGLRCSSRYRVWLYANGRPSVVVLTASSTIGKRPYPRGTELLLGPRGGVLEHYLRDLDSGQEYPERVCGVHEVPWA